MKMDLSQWVSQDPEIMSGEFRFIGTRVPISVLFENLEAGLSVDEILKNWPTIPREAISDILKSCLFEILATTTPKKITIANGEWAALINKNMERMSVDEAYRLEISKNLS